MTTKVEVTNTFHGTSCTLKLVPGQVLSSAQERKVRSLCGIPDCTCHHTTATPGWLVWSWDPETQRSHLRWITDPAQEW